ncbi:NAD(P)-dependent oxidoreductase [Mycoplasmatota bacterium]|nr:NAD(P)-dependent oxidoreductase [Mycoplasmatota bacterium]
MDILFIGTGVMGAPMAKHLSHAGHKVYAYNRTHAKAKALEPDVIAVDSIKDSLPLVDIVFTIVGYPSDVEEVYQEVIKYAKKDTILVDMTTSSPALAKKLYKQALSKNLFMLDAPVTGGDLGAINQTLSIMVGGDKKIFQKVKPLLEVMGKTITYMGNEGSGMTAKLCNQTVIAGNILGIAEALVLAESKGLDKDAMLNVIVGGSASSWQAQFNGRKMIDKDYEPGFFVKHYLKDLKLAVEEKGDLPLHVLETAKKAYQLLSDKGFEDQGTQSIVEAYLREWI